MSYSLHRKHTIEESIRCDSEHTSENFPSESLELKEAIIILMLGSVDIWIHTVPKNINDPYMYTDVYQFNSHDDTE